MPHILGTDASLCIYMYHLPRCLFGHISIKFVVATAVLCCYCCYCCCYYCCYASGSHSQTNAGIIIRTVDPNFLNQTEARKQHPWNGRETQRRAHMASQSHSQRQKIIYLAARAEEEARGWATLKRVAALPFIMLSFWGAVFVPFEIGSVSQWVPSLPQYVQFCIYYKIYSKA